MEDLLGDLRTSVNRGATYCLFGSPDRFMDQARALGNRFVRVNLFRSQIEPEPGTYDWTEIEPNIPMLWSGDPDDYLAHLSVFHQAVKQADQGALVALGAAVPGAMTAYNATGPRTSTASWPAPAPGSTSSTSTPLTTRTRSRPDPTPAASTRPCPPHPLHHPEEPPMKLLKTLIPDVLLPIAVYYLCRRLGVEDELALLLGAAAALIRVLLVAIVSRRFNGLATLVCAGFAIGVLLTLLTGDPRFLLAKESVLSGLLGLLLLGSCLTGKPLMYTLMRRLTADDPAKLAEWEQRWQSAPQFRQVFRTLTLVWGFGLLAESIIRIPLVYSLPLDVMAGLSTVLQLASFALLIGWSLLYRQRRMSRAEAR
ncbi:VC0807 family protein [Nonomuraea sp. CA-141351]|uniref:VC0807 family protein n=1 Tax=Nonomuraea sp. CA-141351 TaxID=3239996 RepID=UPI003D8ABF29